MGNARSAELVRAAKGQGERKWLKWLHGGMSVARACRLSGLGRTELYKRMDAGLLAFTKQGKRRLVSRKAVAEMLAAGEPDLTPDG